MQTNKIVDIIIPTFNNVDQLSQALASMSITRLTQSFRLIIINNGDGDLQQHLSEVDFIKVINAGENLGWTGGLKIGLEHSNSEYVMFANDDIFIPRASFSWLKEMVRLLDTMPFVGAVGPTSNVVMGKQNIWGMPLGRSEEVRFLIGFCILLRRSALDAAGGVHDMQYGGDDLDLSIRIRKAGYCLAVHNEVFVYHHGFQTGNRVHGAADKPNGWNSREMTDNTNMELIRKHGFIEWLDTITNAFPPIQDSGNFIETETEVIKKYVEGDHIIEVGCGARRTVSNAICVDRIPKGDDIPFVNDKSIADVVSDATKLPFESDSQDCVIARHILEHCLDTVSTLKEWARVLKDGGRMIITCPDERVDEGITINPEHVHAFTADTLKSLADVIGLTEIGRDMDYNGISFTVCLQKGVN